MMGQNKIKIKENDEIGVFGANKRRSIAEVDHWAFLEEIEAPMWADLTLEPNMVKEDRDDAWFCTSHPFHHLPARQLRSAFAHPDMGNDLLNFNPQGVCSPNLPSSVSKSRGKDYTSKHWKNNAEISLSKNHPVNDLIDKVSRLAPSQDSKPNFISTEMHPEGSNSINSVIYSDGCATTVSSHSQVAPDDVGTSGSLNSQSASTSGVTTSTITTLSEKQDSKLSEVSKETFGMTGNLLYDLRINLRKSCVTRPASRIAVCDERVSKGRKSSSGKSSVGSSTSIGYDGKGGKRSSILTKADRLEEVKTGQNTSLKPKGLKSSTGKLGTGISNPMLEAKEKAAGFKQNLHKFSGARDPNVVSQPRKGVISSKPSWGAPVKKMVDRLKQKEHRSSYIRDVGKLAPPVKGLAKAQKLFAVSDKARIACNSRIEGRNAIVASTNVEATKSKAPENVTHRPRIGAPGVRGKVGRGHLNESSCATKEKKRVPLSQISSGKHNMPVVRTINQKIPKKLSENKGSLTSVGSKQVNARRLDGSKLSSDARVYLR